MAFAIEKSAPDAAVSCSDLSWATPSTPDGSAPTHSPYPTILGDGGNVHLLAHMFIVRRGMTIPGVRLCAEIPLERGIK